MLRDPYTNEIVEDDDRPRMRHVVNRLGEEIDSYYRAINERREIMNLFLYELAGEPAVLPSPRNRTATQERVAACPRCGTRDGKRPDGPIDFVLRKIDGGGEAA